MGTIGKSIDESSKSRAVSLRPIPPSNDLPRLMPPVPTVLAFAYLLLRSGLLAVTVAIYVFYLLVYLPLTADLSAPATGASIFLVCAVAALAVFGFHSTLAGRPLFKLDL
jgi:hypothetical protein